jgi:hypothetical protein
MDGARHRRRWMNESSKSLESIVPHDTLPGSAFLMALSFSLDAESCREPPARVGRGLAAWSGVKRRRHDMSVDFDVRFLTTIEFGGVQRPCWDIREGRPSLNLTNSNAHLILDTLGIECKDLCGQVEPHDLLSRIGRARRSVSASPDEFGRSFDESGGPGTGQCRMISCGIDAEGVLERLARLEAVALACGDGDMVGWA